MNKLISSVFAVAVLSTGAAFAQSAECQQGISSGMWGNACADQNTQHRDPWGRDRLGYGYYGGAAAVLPQIFGSNAYPYQYAPRQVVPRYNPTRRDRDGDGVPNRHDRYPDDPRYR